MKPIYRLRQCGYDLLQISLGIAIALGLMVGGMALFGQTQTAGQMNDIVRSAAYVSAEVRLMYEAKPDFSDISEFAGGIGDEAGSLQGTPFAEASGIPVDYLVNLQIGPGRNVQEFALRYLEVNPSTCAKVAAFSMGQGSESICTLPDGQSTGEVTIYYPR